VNCSSCGIASQPDAKFCAACGSPKPVAIPEPSEAARSVLPSGQPSITKVSTSVKVLLAVLVVVGLAVAIPALRLNTSPASSASSAAPTSSTVAASAQPANDPVLTQVSLYKQMLRCGKSALRATRGVIEPSYQNARVEDCTTTAEPQVTCQQSVDKDDETSPACFLPGNTTNGISIPAVMGTALADEGNNS
jgi:hypothetical protein